jgi:hypothetical protein
MDRRKFVAGSMAAAAAALQWLRSAGALAATAPSIPAHSPASTAASNGGVVFAALVRAMLPFEDPRFAAITPVAVQKRADALFKLSLDQGVQANLALFNDLHLFQSPPPELLTGEAAYFPADETERGIQNPIAARLAKDVKTFASFDQKLAYRAGSFTDLHLADARAYCLLWARSALGMRRRFYQSAKALIMATTYSMDEVWPAIGYAGPLLHLRPR